MTVADATVTDSAQSSSVADLIEEIQDRIPEDKIDNIFPVLNRAIRTINKRLFLCKSDLILGSLWAESETILDYTADTIAFVVASRTITDSASQFVIEGFTAGMYITTDSTDNPGPFRIESVVAGTITLERDYSLTVGAAGSDVTITSMARCAALPDDFWGLCDKPNINGKLWLLEPLPGRLTELQYISAGEPKYFKIKGTDIYFYPPTSSNITIVGDYWKKNAVITQMEDFIPFSQLLDDAIQEYLVMALGGGAAMTSEQLNNFLNEAVDLVVNNRAQKTATEFPAGIQYEAL
jgi:hypothetical protein